MKNMNDILRQAQVMQNKMAKIQQEMAEQVIETSAGGGMVKVSMNGRQELKSVQIAPAAIADGDVEMLQDLILSAVNEGVRITRETYEREMASLTGGIHIPGMF